MPRIKDEPLPDTRMLPDLEEFTDDEGDDLSVAEDDGHIYYEDGEFKIKTVPEPVIVNRLLHQLYDLSKTPYMKLDPEYQREVVWDESRASGLIASLMQGYFIPPVIFNVQSVLEQQPDGSKSLRTYRICVDGKQRLTSMQKFFEGQIGFLDSSSPPKKWYYDYPRDDKGNRVPNNHNILPQKTKKVFERRTFCCYEYNELKPQLEENMFQLVQRGMPLTPAEKLRAMSTNWANFAKQYEQDYPSVIALCAQKRASGFRAVVSIFSQILEIESPSGRGKNREGVGHKPVLATNPKILQKLIQNDRLLDEGIKALYKRVFDKFQKLLKQVSKNPTSVQKLKPQPNSAFAPAPDFLRDPRVGHVKTFAPIELLATGVLLSKYMDERSDAMLLGDIAEMRHYLRENHKDLRVNGACWASVWEYLDDVMIQRRGGRGAVANRNFPDRTRAVISSKTTSKPVANVPQPPTTSRFFDSGHPETVNDDSAPSDLFVSSDDDEPVVVASGPSRIGVNGTSSNGVKRPIEVVSNGKRVARTLGSKSKRAKRA